MPPTGLQRGLLGRLDETLDAAAASTRWSKAANAVLLGSPGQSLFARAAVSAALSIGTVYLAPIWLPTIVVTSIGLRRERRRAQQRLHAQLERARGVLAALGSAPPGAAFRRSAGPGVSTGESPAELAAACVAADRLLVLRASVSAATRRDPELIYNGVALAAVLADQALLAFAVWSAERDLNIDRFLSEVRDSVRAKLPHLLAAEYWSWNRGNVDSLDITRV